MRRRRLAIAALVGVIALLVAAGLVVTRGFDWRTRVEVAHASLSPEGALALLVDTCGGEPVIDLLEETGDEVRVAVVSTRRMFRGGGDCRDSVEVPLTAPLGERTIVDVTSGTSVDLQN